MPEVTSRARKRSITLAPPDLAAVDELLTVDQVAEVCGVIPRRVVRWLDEHRIEYVQLPKGRRVRRSALDDFLNAATVPPAAA
jgi:excisionase family DNA binding protein